MKIHIQAIHDQVTYPCKVCPYKSSTPRYLSLHVKSKHSAQEYTWNNCLDNKKEKIMMPRQPDKKIWARLSFESFIRDYKMIHMWVTHSISLNQGCRKVELFQKLNKLATTIETTLTQRQTNKLSRFKLSGLKQTPTCYIIIEANLVAFPTFPTTVRFVTSAPTEEALLERKLFIIICNPKLNNHCNHKQSTFAMAKIF